MNTKQISISELTANEITNVNGGIMGWDWGNKENLMALALTAFIGYGVGSPLLLKRGVDGFISCVLLYLTMDSDKKDVSITSESIKIFSNIVSGLIVN